MADVFSRPSSTLESNAFSLVSPALSRHGQSAPWFHQQVTRSPKVSYVLYPRIVHIISLWCIRNLEIIFISSILL
jgi:hypothetical protein